MITTGEGANPVSGQRFRMTRGIVSKDYRDQIRALIARAKSDGSSGLTLDGCLHLLAIVADNWTSSRGGLRVAHTFYHMRCGNFCKMDGPESSKEEEVAAIINAPKAVNLFDFGMRNSLALPPLLWYPRDVMLDVLMGRIMVFAQFDHEKFFELTSRSGLKMGFLRGKEAARIRTAQLGSPLIEYRDMRYVRGQNDQGMAMVFGARFFLYRPRFPGHKVDVHAATGSAASSQAARVRAGLR